MRRRRFRPLAVALALALLLTACGETAESAPETTQAAPSAAAPSETAAMPQSTQAPQAQTGYAYRVEWTALHLGDMVPEELFFVDGRLMLEVSPGSGGRAVWDVEAETLREVQGLDTAPCAVAGGDGCLWFCAAAEEGLTLYRTAPEGGATEETVALGETETPYDLAVDGDGNFYLLGAEWLRVYTPQGSLAADFPVDPSAGLTRLQDGQVVLWSSAPGEEGPQGKVQQVGTESVSASLTGGGTVYRTYPGWTGTALLSGGGVLYALDISGEGGMTPVLDWIDTDVDPETVVSAAALDQETIYLVSRDQEGASLGALRREKAEPRTEPTVQVGYYVWDQELEPLLSALAVAFNRSESGWRVHLVNYRSYAGGWEKLQTDGAELDLVLTDLEDLGDLETLDLRTLFDGDVGEDTLAPWVTAHFTGDMGMPLYVTVRTLLGSESVLGPDQGWTPEDLASAAEARPEAAIFQYHNAYDTLKELLRYTGAYVTDSEPLVRAAAGQPAREEAIFDLPANLEGQGAPCLKDGSLLLMPVELTGFSDWTVLEVAVEDGVLKGYPADQGNGGVLVPSRETACIPAGSGQPEGAWAFLKTLLLSDRMEDYRQSHGFPLLLGQYGEMESAAMEGIRYETGDGESVQTGGQVAFDGDSYEVAPLSQDQADSLRAYLGGLSGFAAEAGTDGAMQALEERLNQQAAG